MLIHRIYNLRDYVYEQDYTVYTVYTTQVLIHCIYNLRDYVYEQDYTVYTTQVLIYSIYNLRDYVYNQANVCIYCIKNYHDCIQLYTTIYNHIQPGGRERSKKVGSEQRREGGREGTRELGCEVARE